MTISVTTVLVLPPTLLTTWWCPPQWSRPPTWWPPSLSTPRGLPFAASILLPLPPPSSTDTPKPITRSSTWHSSPKNTKVERRKEIAAAVLSTPRYPAFSSISTQYWLPSLSLNRPNDLELTLINRAVPERKTTFFLLRINYVALNKDLMRFVYKKIQRRHWDTASSWALWDFLQLSTIISDNFVVQRFSPLVPNPLHIKNQL